ncbi:hypothetical protein [Bosea sp. FBZP-16]|uniref:hypothetical protein n=1 Tax=Bosea sp. FBZP-16 TaxID=2065382 RepID=UPI000C300AA9|nr:hypothetical protein [Bosea sp. FBZP-16]
MIVSWLAGLRQAVSSKLTIGIGGLLALAITSGQSLLEALEPPVLPALAAGAPLDAGRWRIALHEARLTTQSRPDGPPASDGAQFLALDLDVGNRSSETDNTFARILIVDPPVEGLQPNPTIWLMRDKAMLSALQPGLPERVQVIWRLAPGAKPPERLRLVVIGETFKPRDNLLAAPGWFNRKPIAAATLPVARAEIRP